MEHEAVVYNATLGIIARADDRRIKLADKSRSLRMGLDRLGYHVTTGQSHIIALQSGDEARTIVLRDALESRGVFGSVFCWPATGKGRALVRFSVNSGLSDAALGKILVVCEEIRGEIELASWAGNRSLRKKAG
jgi:CAI-1 autoinducer synthase